jgi:hypothetical protein
LIKYDNCCDDGYAYVHPLGVNVKDQTWFSFQVKGCADAFLVLSAAEDTSTDTYLIGIGTGGNMKSKISLGLSDTKTEVSHSPLHCDEYRSFWVRWDDNVIQLGSGGVGDTQWMSWPSTVDFTINYIGLGYIDAHEVTFLLQTGMLMQP